METLSHPKIEYGIAKFILPGQEECGDQQLISSGKTTLLVAAVDGLGHGKEAAKAAKAATSILAKGCNEPIVPLVQRCHEQLRATRGVTLSLASVHLPNGTMTWLGVGNVQGILVRGGFVAPARQEVLLLRPGVVGSQIPPLQAAVLSISEGDTLVFVTDGVRGDFIDTLRSVQAPQRTADLIHQQYRSGMDDALVLIVRFSRVRT